MNRALVVFVLTAISGVLLEGGETVLRWAADSSSGVPGVYRDPNNINVLKGFEKEIIEAVAKDLGMKPVLVENEWSGLIPALDRNLYDAVINAMPMMPEGEKIISYSKPYYVTYQLMAVHKDNNKIKSLEDCKGLTVATVRNAQAVKILQGYPEINTRIYVEDTALFHELNNKRVDAILLDAPIIMYYGGIDRNLKIINTPIDRMEYCIVLSKSNTELLIKINRALDRLIKDGTIKSILERWNLWNAYTAALFEDFSPTVIEPTEYYNFLKEGSMEAVPFKVKAKQYLSYLPILGRGALITIELSLLAMVLAILLGFFLAITRTYAPRPFSRLAQMYIEIIRGTPLLIQLYFIFYGLPTIGINLPPFTSGVLALGLNYAAYEAEIYRSGLLAVPQGQMEAARALGMSHWQGLRYVVIPQAFSVVLPPVTNDFISLLKDSSLVSVITIVDLAFAYGILSNTYYNYFGIAILVAAIYLLLGLPFVQLARWAEKRLAVEKKRLHS